MYVELLKRLGFRLEEGDSWLKDYGSVKLRVNAHDLFSFELIIEMPDDIDIPPINDIRDVIRALALIPRDNEALDSVYHALSDVLRIQYLINMIN
ncbi:hypothetical protein [Vulcanisaeta thermophila]|uniref:hypothetical protein n=1 Tax=Vulcanisaeta thermophila TaxID=867917 RepID=UPI00085296BA|nr:hypothetical protein [Vulcanisaeta thermophila]